MSEVSNFLSSASSGQYDSVSFENVGDSVAGEIVSLPKVVDTQYGRRLVVDLQPASGDPKTLWIKEGSMARAVSSAVKAAGVTDLAVGGKLQVTFSDEGTPSQKGFNPPKFYEARYEAPAAGVAVDDIFSN